MKKLLYIALFFVSFQLDANRKQFTIFVSPVVNKDAQELNVDIPRSKTFVIPEGTYRLTTNAGPTNKYVTFPVDGAIRQDWTYITCFYIKNNENKYDKLGCLDTTRIMNNNLSINLG